MSVITSIHSAGICPICEEERSLEEPGWGHLVDDVYHIFHAYCLMECFERNNFCPLCDTRLVFVYEEPLNRNVGRQIAGFKRKVNQIAALNGVLEIYAILSVLQREQTVYLRSRMIVIEKDGDRTERRSDPIRPNNSLSTTPCCAIL